MELIEFLGNARYGSQRTISQEATLAAVLRTWDLHLAICHVVAEIVVYCSLTFPNCEVNTPEGFPNILESC